MKKDIEEEFPDLKDIDEPEETAIANVHLPAMVDNSPMALIRVAIEKGVDPDKMTALYNLAERWETNQAAKAFAEAIQKFQEKMPAIVKGNPVRRSEAKGGGLMYLFASYDDIMEVARPFLNEFGIVPTFTTAPGSKPGLTAFTCRIRVGTHSEPTVVELGLPGILNANDAQQAGGALSYGKRYALCAALNIVTKGEDNDGMTQVEMIGPEETAEINGLFEECRQLGKEVDSARFFKLFGIEDLNGMKKKDFTRAIHELTRKRKAPK